MAKIQPWDLKKDQVRTPDILPTFIIFCEDEVSEPVYFKYFETPSIKVNPIKSQKSKMDNVLKAIHHCNKNKLISPDGDQAYTLEESVQVWCVFDRDKNTENEEEENTNFDTSISTASTHGINVAWSNDSFELWVLLHFEDIRSDVPSSKNRDFYYDRLTEVFKSLPDKSEDLQKILSYESFSYKGKLKTSKHFRNIVRKELIKKTKLAIKRAQKLESKFSTEPFSQRSPCTLVHHLVEELILVGEKKYSPPT